MELLFEFEHRRSDGHALAGLDKQPCDAPGARRGDLNDGLFSLDSQQWLIGDDVIALGHVPSDDFGFLQAFAEIGEIERSHV
jgi:hypothetical protein